MDWVRVGRSRTVHLVKPRSEVAHAFGQRNFRRIAEQPPGLGQVGLRHRQVGGAGGALLDRRFAPSAASSREINSRIAIGS